MTETCRLSFVLGEGLSSCRNIQFLFMERRMAPGRKGRSTEVAEDRQVRSRGKIGSTYSWQRLPRIGARKTTIVKQAGNVDDVPIGPYEKHLKSPLGNRPNMELVRLVPLLQPSDEADNVAVATPSAGGQAGTPSASGTGMAAAPDNERPKVVSKRRQRRGVLDWLEKKNSIRHHVPAGRRKIGNVHRALPQMPQGKDG